MDFSYAQAMDYLSSLPVFTPKAVAEGSRIMNLDSLRILLRRLGNPQDKLKYIHVAGTNGKGSFCAFLGSILTESGRKTGSFTSPAVFSFTETICVNQTAIAGVDVGRLLAAVKKEADGMAEEGVRYPSEFELTLALAFLYFVEQGCELVILETGLGGSMDATNIIAHPLLCVLTTISHDHMQLLGNTLAEIAEKKAGIIKKNSQALTCKQEPEVMQVLKNACEKTASRLHVAKEPGQVRLHENTQDFYLEGVGSFWIPSVADYQTANAALAVSAALLLQKRGYPISVQSIRSGLMNTRLRGRFEQLGTGPAVIADGAHNLQGVRALAGNLRRIYPGQKICFVVGVFADKQHEEMIQELLPLAKKFYAITPPSIRALEKETLCAYVTGQGAACETAESAKEALLRAKEEATEKGAVCICGSLSILGQLVY